MSIFSKIENTRVKSNTFNLTHDVKLSAKFGTLTPICVMDVLPGDSFNIHGNAMVRLAPMIAPVMGQADVFLHYFFVPNRILWGNWEDFITAGPEGDLAPNHPYVNWDAAIQNENQLGGYLGLPTSGSFTGSTALIEANALPFAAYAKIYDDYFKDQTFSADQQYTLQDGDNSGIPNLFSIKKRAWAHDYFTSALPWTQRGPEVLLPLGVTAPLERIVDGSNDTFQFMKNSQGVIGVPQGNANIVTGVGGSIGTDDLATPESGYVAVEDSHFVDLSQATASSIQDLRRAFKLQEFLEKSARGGSRYIEQIQIMFGVASSDKRLQRAEFIGGVSSPIKFSEVLQNSASNSDVQTFDTPQGNMAGHGISVGGSRNLKYRAEEHGYIIGIMSILPKAAYSQGVPKHFSRSDRFDYAFPTFAHIGEQEILNQEMFVTDSVITNQETWGYTPRYAEYKFQNNRICGDFVTSLDFWHMGRKFDTLPALNQDFIEMSPEEVERIFAVQDGTDPLWVQVLNQVSVKRKLPIFGTPHL